MQNNTQKSLNPQKSLVIFLAADFEGSQYNFILIRCYNRTFRVLFAVMFLFF